MDNATTSEPLRVSTDDVHVRSAGADECDIANNDDSRSAPPTVPIVAIGASAGGLEALEDFFRSVKPNTGVAYVVIQHLSSDHKSMMAELLARQSPIPIRTVQDGDVPHADLVHLIPPGQELELLKGRLCLRSRPPGLRLPIDCFLESVAREQGSQCVAVILSGTGSDGSRGARFVKAAGGFVLAQDPRTARFAGMPESAIATGTADLVLPPGEIPEQARRLLNGMPHAVNLSDADHHDDTATGYQRVFELLKSVAGVNFALYKPTTVARRVMRRMAVAHTTQLEDYVTLLTSSAQEREALFHELLIGVTSFFRDEEAFQRLRDHVIGPLVGRSAFGDALRIWVPGCSTGEEAYSLAMLIHEEMEAQGVSVDVKIFASDVDQRALEIAGRGIYAQGAIAGISDDRLAKFFRPADNGLQVVPAIRSMVLFARHDITSDPPFTRLDLISCRNLMIYLAAPQQRSLFTAFHVALREGGALFLGTSETVGGDNPNWRRLSSEVACYRPVGDLRSELMSDRTNSSTYHRARSHPSPARTAVTSPVHRAAAALVHGSGLSAVLVDEEFKVLHVFGRAGGFLQMPDGAPVLSILHLTPQPLSAILASGVPRVIRSGKSVSYRDIKSMSGTGPARLRILPSPESGDRREALIVFEESGAEAFTHSGRDVHVDSDAATYLSDLQVELQYAREGHQALVEELASSNEELQASNEELLAANEELQSTNEELQSVNEELHTLNMEFQRKILELEDLSADLDSLLAATDIGTLFLDDDLAIRRYTPSMTGLLPLMDHDLGRSVAHFSGDLGPGFLDELQKVLRTGEVVQRTFQLRSIPMLVRIMRVSLRAQHGLVVTFTDVSVVERAFEVTQLVLNAIPAQVALVSDDGTIRLTNAAWDKFAIENGADPTRVGVGANYLAVCQSDPEAGLIAAGVRGVLDRRHERYSAEYPCHSPNQARWFLMDCKPSEKGGAVITHFDVTERKLAELRLQGLATTDPLTSVLNRRGLEERLTEEMDQVRRLGVPLSVIMVDCDDFKVVNDRLGHAAGDVVLRSVVDKIRSELRSQDSMARIGGDEFIILLPETSAAEAQQLAERLRLAVCSQPVAISDEYIQLSVSMSVAQADLEVTGTQDLLARSRNALNSSKKRGKNRVTFAADMGGVVHDVEGIRHVLQQILDDDKALTVVGQPIVDQQSHHMVGVELLSRSVYHPHIQPMTLFRTAREEELLTELDMKCLGACLRACATLPEDLFYSVNIYPSTLLSIAVDDLANVLGAAGGRNICLEISEQQIIGDPAYLLDHVAVAREAGVQIALDDVGFGRTSLEALIVLEPEVVKIDRAFIKGVTSSGSRSRWLDRLVRTTQALGARVVGEGVETLGELTYLDELGVGFVQGYYFKAAVGVGDLPKLHGRPILPACRP